MLSNMPKRSLNSPRSGYLHKKEELLAYLREGVSKLLKTFIEVEEVWLFGSFSRQDWGIKSDADILITLSESPWERFFDRIPKYMDIFLKVPLSVDIFPYTRNEIARMIEAGNLFILRILKERIPLVVRE